MMFAGSDRRAAFEDVMRAQQRRVLGVACRLLGRVEDAQDVAQEVFMKLYKHFDRLSPDASIEAWLYRTTVNACWDCLRARPKTEELVFEPVAFGDPLRSAAARQQLNRVEQALLRLGDRERAALVLRDIEGLTTREVAAIFGTEEVTIRSQIATARIKLKRMLEQPKGGAQ